MVVVDEAYAEFRRAETPSALTLLDGNPRLIVTRTMSKAFAMAGTRLGYLAALPPCSTRCCSSGCPTTCRPSPRPSPAPPSPTARSCSAASRPCAGSDEIVAWLRAEGFRVADSDANFVLFGTFPDRRRVWENLLERGVLIREVGPPEWLRVSVGTPKR